MANKNVYQFSARQILLFAFVTALTAVGATAVLYWVKDSWNTVNPAATTFAESTSIPVGISDPQTVSDEQNSIEVYRTVSPGVAFINTTSVRETFYGPQEGKGNGSGSVIDNNGHILTNYHVVEGAQKLTVSFGGDKVYDATYVGGDPDTDLAVIKITRRPPDLPLFL